MVSATSRGSPRSLHGGIRSPSLENLILVLAERSRARVREFSQAVGRGKSRTDIVDEDAIFAELIGQALDEANNRGPHRVRIDEIGHRLLGSDRGDRNDASPFFLLHVRDDLVREVNRTHEVHFDGALPLVDGGSKKAFGRRASGIGDADIGAAKFLNHRADKIADRILIGDVEGLRKHLRIVLSPDLLGDGVERFAIASADGQTTAFGGKASAVARPIPWLDAATMATRSLSPVSISG
jgi:hypothetical protein